ETVSGIRVFGRRLEEDAPPPSNESRHFTRRAFGSRPEKINVPSSIWAACSSAYTAQREDGDSGARGGNPIFSGRYAAQPAVATAAHAPKDSALPISRNAGPRLRRRRTAGLSMRDRPGTRQYRSSGEIHREGCSYGNAARRLSPRRPPCIQPRRHAQPG